MDIAKPITALFDFDGVVMDTETQYSIFWDKQGHTYHPGIEHFDRLIKGQTLIQIFEKHFAGMEDIQNQILEELYRFEKEMSYEYIAGIETFIDDLRAHDVKIAIVTSSNDHKMEHVYRVHPDLKERFGRIITSDMFTRSKPDPECFLLGAGLFGSAPENCYVFEDSFHGLEAGNRAGMTVIGLSTTNPYETIKDKAHLVIPDFEGFTFDKMIDVKSGY